MNSAVLGIDPGTRKVGFAVITDATSPPLALGIEPLETLIARLQPVVEKHPLRAIALGAGTNAGPVQRLLQRFGAPLHLIDESDTTYRARALYFAAHPPRGWKRLLPVGFQLPPRPIDDYAALLIARRYLERGFDVPLP